MVGCHGQAGNGPLHGEVGGAENIAGVDFRHRGRGERPAQAGMGGEGVVESLAFRRAELLRIVEPWTVESGGEDDRGGGHRTREWAAARFVHARYERIAGGVELAFEGEIRHGVQWTRRLLSIDIWDRLMEREPNTWVANTVPSESITTPTPELVQELRRLCSWGGDFTHRSTR